MKAAKCKQCGHEHWNPVQHVGLGEKPDAVVGSIEKQRPVRNARKSEPVRNAAAESADVRNGKVEPVGNAERPVGNAVKPVGNAVAERQKRWREAHAEEAKQRRREQMQQLRARRHQSGEA